ncbi:hypothetical protein TIFTF001_049758 [Ficus carica]|uniref:Uncharacterized protein n=1 Tax=Ficus carica TaxID=3494 RepID=A0AA87ZFL3_FICCA|nr:hypothetical protein TIFTF001_049758 [Ficus carica]
MTMPSSMMMRDSEGIDVCHGLYERRRVIIKRFPRSNHNVVDNEINVLLRADHHKNIARYHALEEDDNFFYLAMEDYECNFSNLMPKSIANNVENESILGDNMKLWRENDKRPSPILLGLLRDIASGIAFLHKNRLVHRTLNPENILIKKETTTTVLAKLSDMGFTKELREDVSSISSRGTGYGMKEFKAPEQLRSERQTLEVDMHGLGCVFFYGITQGSHPFGEADVCAEIISKKKPSNLIMLDHFPEAKHLILRLLEDEPEKRPKIAEVLQHPMFWGAKKRLNFLRDTSDEANNNREFWKAMQNTRKKVFRGQWNSKVDKMITDHVKQFINRDFNFERVPDLLRLIRNMFSHLGQLPSNIQTLVGSQDEEFDDYFTSRFPELLIEVYKVVCGNFVCRYGVVAYYNGTFMFV